MRKVCYAACILVTHFKLILYLLKGEEPPICIPCDQLCSVEHLLTECVGLVEWRRQFFKTESLKIMFRECSLDNFVRFLKQTNFYLTKCDSTIVHHLLGVLFSVITVQ